MTIYTFDKNGDRSIFSNRFETQNSLTHPLSPIPDSLALFVLQLPQAVAQLWNECFWPLKKSTDVLTEIPTM